MEIISLDYHDEKVIDSHVHAAPHAMIQVGVYHQTMVIRDQIWANVYDDIFYSDRYMRVHIFNNEHRET